MGKELHSSIITAAGCDKGAGHAAEEGRKLLNFVVEVHTSIMCFWRAWNLSKHFHCHGKFKTFHFLILTFSSTPACRNQTFWSHMVAWSKLFFRRQSSLFMFTLQLLLFGFYFSHGYVC